MHFSRAIFSLFICCPSLSSSDAPTPPETPHKTIVPLSRIIAPFAQIRINQNGIGIPALEGITYWDAQAEDYIINDYTYTDSAEFIIKNQWRETVWIHDPQKKSDMPTLLHHATKALLFTKVALNKPTRGGTIDYKIQSYQPTDESVMEVVCTAFSNGKVRYQGRLVCENSLNTQGPLENPTLKNLHTFTLTAHNLLGSGALVKLCMHLPQLRELCILNTKFDDTRLTLVHDRLNRCKIENCGIRKIGSIIAPQLDFLSLKSNKLQRFDIHTLDLQPCTIDLRNNNISRVCADEEPTWQLPQSYLYLQGNPLDKKATYQALFKKEMPENETHLLDRSNNTLLLDHHDFAFHINGIVENYKKPEAKKI